MKSLNPCRSFDFEGPELLRRQRSLMFVNDDDQEIPALVRHTSVNYAIPQSSNVREQSSELCFSFDLGVNERSILVTFSDLYWNHKVMPNHPVLSDIWKHVPTNENRQSKRSTQQMYQCGGGLLEVERVLHAAVLSPIYNICGHQFCRGGVHLPYDLGEEIIECGPPSFYFVYSTSEEQYYAPYISDCYNSLNEEEDYLKALMLISQQGAAMMAHSGSKGCVLSICCREFIEYSFAEETEVGKCKVVPLTRRLSWNNEADMTDFHMMREGLAYWLQYLIG